jgi:3-oxoacyl-[acyl-carrier protein] reductase
MDLKLTNKRVVITGSSRGIGFAVAQTLHREGARVVISGRNSKKVLDGRKKLDCSDNRVAEFVGDLTISEEMERLLGVAMQVWGGIDVLVLNLGSGRAMGDLQADASEWERVLRLNLIASAEMLRLATPLLGEGRDPAVIFVGSIAGLEALGAPWPYGASKAGLIHLTKQAARHLAAKNIRVNMVAPGNIIFEEGTWDRKIREDPSAVEAMLKVDVPQGRFGTVDEVAAAVAFLASPVSGFTTGSCLTVDGGQTRH